MVSNHRICRKSLGRLSAVFLLAALLLPVFCVPGVYAEPDASDSSVQEPADSPDILYGVDSGVLTAHMSQKIELFNDPQAEAWWQTAYETTRLSCESVLPWEKRGAFEGDRCLVLTTDSYSTYGGMNAERSFRPDAETGEDYPDFSRAAYFTAAVCAPALAGRSYTVTVTLLSAMISASTDGNFLRYSKQFTVRGGEWAVLLCDISDFEGRAEIQRISLKVTSDDAAYGSGVSFAFDALGVCADEKLTDALRYLSSSFRAENGTAAVSDGLVLSAGGTDPVLWLDSLGALSFSGEDAVRLRFSNGTACRAISLYYTLPDGTEHFSAAVEVAASPGVQYAYFPMPKGAVSSMRLVFDGDLTGDIAIYGITPASYYVSGVEKLGSISVCELSGASTVTVSGTLDSAVSEKYRSASVCLYELEAYQSEEDAVSGAARLLDEQPAGKSFAFSVSVDPQDRSFLTRKYAVILSCTDGLLPVDTAKYLSNPEALSSSGFVFPETDSKKGTHDALVRDVTDGVRHTYLEVRLEKLCAGGSDGYVYETDGIRYYYNRLYLEELDAKILALTGKGITVTLVLTASYTEDRVLDRTLLFRDTDPEAAYGAFNTGTQEGVRTLRAACDLLSARYGSGDAAYGSVSRYVVGKNVENMAAHYSMGAEKLSVAAARYADALRIVYNTVKANCAGARVYLSLGSDWNSGITRQERYRFDSRSVLDTVAAKIQAEGDIGWNVAFDPYPEDEDYLACLDKNAGADAEAPYVTLANPEVLTTYVQRKALYCGGNARSVLLIEQFARETDLGDEEKSLRQSADYAYAYYKLSLKSYSPVEALIIAHRADYRETLRYIDTASSAAVTAYALELMQIGDFREVIPSFEMSRAVRRSLKTGMALADVPADAHGSMPFLQFDGAGYGVLWHAEEGCGEPGTGTVVSGHGTVLTVGLTSAADAGRHTFRASFGKTADLSFCPYLKTELFLSTLPEGTEDVWVTLILGSGDSYISVRKQVKAEEWTTVVMDASTFDGLKSCDSLRIRVTAEDGKELDGASVTLGAVSLISTVYDDAELAEAFRRAQAGQTGAGIAEKPAQVNTKAVIALLLVMIVAFTAEVFHVLSRRRRLRE